MTQHRFFAASPEVYETIRTTLDAAWGLPNSKGTTTCLRPAADLGSPRDGNGRVVVAVLVEWCAWDPAATMLPQLLAGGTIEEITEATYQDAVNLIPLPTPIPEGDTFPVSPSNPRFMR